MKKKTTLIETSMFLLFSFMTAINAFGQTPIQTLIDGAPIGSEISISSNPWIVVDKVTHTDGYKYAMLYGTRLFHFGRFGATNVYNDSDVRTAFTNRYANDSEYNLLRQIAVLATLNNAPGFTTGAKSVLPDYPQLASATGATVDVIFLPTYGDVKGWNIVLANIFGNNTRLIMRNPTTSPCSANYLTALIRNNGSVIDDCGIASTVVNTAGQLLFRPCIWVRVSPLPPTIGPITAPGTMCPGDFLSPSAPTITDNGAIITGQGWQIEGSPGIFTNISIPYPVSYNDNGKKLRYYVTFNGGTAYSNEVTISVNPPSVLNQPNNLTFGYGENVAPITFTGTNVSTVAWQVISGSGASIGMSDNSGTGSIPGFTATNATNAPITITIQVTPTSASGCVGEAEYFTITVNPKPAIINHTQVLSCIPVSEIDVFAMNNFACNRNGFDIIMITQPGHADVISGLNGNKNIEYKPNTIFQGVDYMKFYVTCGGTIIDTLLLYINVMSCPDNITDPDCFVEPEPGLWTIGELATSFDGYSPYMTPLIGDIDGDGTVEIIVARPVKSPNLDLLHSVQLEIFKGDDLKPATPWLLDIDSINFSGVGVTATARINGVPFIYTYAKDGRIHAYNPLTNTKVWVTTGMVMGTAYAEGIAPGLADFDGDGQPELYAGNKIYDAATGDLLWSGSGNSGTQVLTEFNRTVNSAISFAVDVTGDGRPNLIAGNHIYDVIIDRTTPRLNQSPAIIFADGFDGFTQVADINCDGHLDVIVSRHRFVDGISDIDVWDVYHNAKLASTSIPNPNGAYMNYPLIGDIDKSGKPSIVVVYQQYESARGGFMDAFKYVNGNPVLQKSWANPYPIAESYARTGITLFDFNHDGTSEIVYRDMEYLRIINGSGIHHVTGAPAAPYNLTTIICSSGTGYEYPVIADVNGDGYAEIVTVGGISTTNYQSSYVRIFGALTGQPWAPARKVWNQYAYNALNVNDNLTIPAHPANPAYIFPNGKQPYNNFLQQQTALSKNGVPLWLAPNAFADFSISSITLTGATIDIIVGISNKGDAALTPPVYVSVYKDAIASGNLITTVSENIQINPGDTAYVSVNIPDLMIHLPVVNLIVNVNDDGTDFPVQAECDLSDNDITFLNPLLSQLMKKDATLLLDPPVQNNGTYANPVSVLFKDTIEYTITAVNANTNTGTLIIRDTLPLYLAYDPGSATTGTNITVATGNTGGTYARDTVVWTITGVASMGVQTVTFKATPVEGVCASQPLFINKAWITAGNTLHLPTNSTYHQGAGMSMVTFSMSVGGSIYNAQPQAIDYRTSPGKGIIIVPDEGYRFAGWSHDEYRSLRGEKIAAQSGIMLYDTLTIYGNVDLIARFEPEAYSIDYFLNGGDFSQALPTSPISRTSPTSPTSPSSYTIESPAIILEAPEKAGDVFIGWTGSNGDEPQMTVTIPGGSTGSRIYYAHFLRSGREDTPPQETHDKDRIWAHKDELYIHTTHPGSIVRIFTPDGVLHKVHTLVSAGETKLKLQPGLYIVTLNNNAGNKIKITYN